MQVARQRESTRRKLLILEIVSGVEGNAPLGRQVHAAVEAERLNHRGRQPRFGIAEAVVEPDVPRDIEVVIARRHHLPPGIGVQIVEARLGEHVGVLGRRSAPAAGKVLSRYGRILAGAVLEIEPCIGCTQPGRWHCYDVWQHTAVAVELLDVAGMDDKNARILRWSVFLHDLAKPECRTVGPDGAAHFPGHNQAGSKMARSILLRLKAPTYLVESASALVAIHDGALPSDDAGILNMLNRYGAAFLQRLCRLKLADLAAHARNAGVMQREQQVRAFEGRMLELSATACYTVGQLAVNGASLMDAGIAPGPAVGKALNTLLRAVMEGRLPNEKAALLAALEKEGLL